MNIYADPTIEGWFASHGLPWSKETALKLEEQGVESVADLKFLDPTAVEYLFKDEKPIVKAKAKAAWKKLEAPPPPPPPPLETALAVETGDKFQPGETKNPRFSIPAGISVGFAVLAVILGIVGCAKAGQAYDCYYGRSYNYYYDEYGNYQSSYGESCDTADLKKMHDAAKGSQLASILFFTIATPLAFIGGRLYLPSKNREDARGDQCCANPKCCPFNMAVYAWIIYLGSLGWGIAFLVFIYAGGYYSYYDGGLHASVLVPNSVAWSLMFGYAEMVRQYKREISTCC